MDYRLNKLEIVVCQVQYRIYTFYEFFSLAGCKKWKSSLDFAWILFMKSSFLSRVILSHLISTPQLCINVYYCNNITDNVW